MVHVSVYFCDDILIFRSIGPVESHPLVEPERNMVTRSLGVRYVVEEVAPIVLSVLLAHEAKRSTQDDGVKLQKLVDVTSTNTIIIITIARPVLPLHLYGLMMAASISDSHGAV